MTRIGILGGGQLGRMLMLAGYPLDLAFHCFDPVTEAPVDALAPRIHAAFEDEEALDTFAASVDIITYEFENVPRMTAERLAYQRPVYPPPAALATSQDRLLEKNFFRTQEIPTVPFWMIDSLDALQDALVQSGTPAFLKTRRLGYDGKGQIIITAPAEAASAFIALGGKDLILEGRADFDRELSLIAVRSRSGAMAFYPLVHNTHRDGILRLSIAPAPDLSPTLQQMAETYATRVLTALDYVGVLAIEWFQVGDVLLANEMAPRVHNSGHWTIEGAETSQFENHLRAILDYPLGATNIPIPTAMLNLIGTIPAPAAVLAYPDTHLHLYSKAPRPGRKLGHITVRAPDSQRLQERIEGLTALL